MATPYFQLKRDIVASTQDIAREALEDLPVLVMARGQTEGRGRGGDPWVTADRALAASLAFRCEPADTRPFSLMAGVAAVRSIPEAALKWPNDVLVGDGKAGGILVERRDDLVVVGFGANLWWREAPNHMTGIYREDPGEDRYAEIGGFWGAELMRLIDGPDWPIEEYRTACVTVGQPVTWEPDGSGHAVGIAPDGGLIVDTDRGRETIYSGAVRLVRHKP